MATRTSVGSGNWSAAGTWDTGVPVDTDVVVIAAGHAVLMDADTSGFASGINGLTINGHATTPGMLYFKDGTNGHLKITSGSDIAGTSGAARGRLLINSDGVWRGVPTTAEDNTYALSASNTAVINLAGGASNILCQYLDVDIRAQKPTTKVVRIFDVKYTCTTQSSDVAPSTDLITFADATPPSAGTAVRVYSTGTLPSPLNSDDLYYVRSITDLGSTFTCKLAYQNADTQVVDITDTGSGTLYMVTGVLNTATTVNVAEDVSGEAAWSTTSGSNLLFLVDIGPASATDQQETTLSSKSSTQLTLGVAVNSDQYPLARLYLVNRNVEIWYGGSTAGNIIFDGYTTSPGSFYCDGCIRATTGTMAYGRGISGYSGYGVPPNPQSFHGVMYNLSSGLYNMDKSTGSIGGYFLGCLSPLGGSYGLEVSSEIAGSGSTSTVVALSHGIFTGTAYGGYYGIGGAGNVVLGKFVGAVYLFSGDSHITTDTFKAYACYATTSITWGNTGLATLGGLVSGSLYTARLWGSVVELRNLTMRGCNVADLGYLHRGFGRNVSLQSPTQVSNYLGNTTPALSYAEDTGLTILGLTGSPTDTDLNYIGAWNVGGNTKTADYFSGTHGVPPFAPPSNGIHVTTCQCNYAGATHYVRIPFFGFANLEIRVVIAGKQVATGFDSRATWEVLDDTKQIGSVGRSLVSWQITDNTDWQMSVLKYTPSVDMPLILRLKVQGGTTSGSGGDDVLYWIYKILSEDTSRPRTRVRP